jgi:nucleotide-binding universal stress UspA family protein
MGQIVVGIDGSRDSEAALFWAAREARLREDRLVILYAVHTPVLTSIAGVADHLGVAPSELLKCIAFDLDGEVALALVPGDRLNLKVTYPDDLELVAAVLAARSRR